MIYTVALIYLAAIVFLELSHRREREKLQELVGKKEKKTSRGRHFSPHRKALEKIRRNEE